MLDSKKDERGKLTANIMFELDSWGFNANQLMDVLQIPAGTPSRALRKYREDTAFPDDENINIRLEHIVGIINALRTSYPHNKNMSAFWMKQNNKRFENKSPVEFIKQHGLDGLITLRKHLDCSYMPD